MLRMLMGHTSEIDDVELAVSEVLSQLDLENNALKNSAGMLICYSGFIESGVVKALCDALPFDVIGVTTIAGATNKESGLMMLTLSVLTSDDVSFSVAMSDPLSKDPATGISSAYEKAASALPDAPKMMFCYMPLMFSLGCDVMLDLLDKASGGVPAFGTAAVDHTSDYHSAMVIAKGEAYREGMALLLLSGDFDMHFYVESISEKMVFKQKAIISESVGNVLMKVNGVPILEHMQSMGLAKNGKIEGLNSIPYLIDLNDGAPAVCRAIFAITPEGYAVCGGDMPINATLSVGSIDYDEVISTSVKSVKEAIAKGNREGLCMFSCVGRLLSLGADTMAEINAIDEAMGGVTYQFSYSGGEICPVLGPNGKWVNRFHNVTFVACAF